MYKTLPLPTLFEANNSVPGEVVVGAEIPVCHLDIHDRYIIFGDLGYGKPRTIIYAQQLVDFLETAKLVLNSTIPMKLDIFMGTNEEFSIRTHDRFMMIAGVKCDPHYATTRWLETVRHLFSIPVKSQGHKEM